MGANSFVGGNFDADSARYDRQNRLNPPEFAPGQGASDDLFSSNFEQPVSGGGMFESFSSPPSNGGGTDIFGGGGTGGNMAGTFNSGGIFGQSTLGQPQQQPTTKSDEEKVWDAIVKGFKGIGNFGKDFINSFSGLTPKFWSLYGKNDLIASLVIVALGFVIRLFGLKFGTDLLIGGLLNGAFGVIVLMFNVEKAQNYTSPYTDSSQSVDGSQIVDQNNTSSSLDFSNMGGGFDDTGFDSPSSDFGDFDSSDSDFGDFDDEGDEFGYSDDDEDEDDFDFDGDEDVLAPVTADGEDIEKALDEMQVIDKGMYTRLYLYDNFIKVLPNLNANFSNVKEYDEDSDVFLSWDDIVQRAAAVAGLKDDDIPYLKALEENLFTIKATISRTPKMKPEIIGDEVAKAYAYNEYDDDEERARVFAKVETVLDECIITVFTGASHMISLKDMYTKCKDFVISTKTHIPVVLGINEKGSVITVDMKNVESLIVAGMPRSGKSWLVQAILTQMCALLPPSELNIFFFDPKAGTSDYKDFRLPHVKKFASKYTDANGLVVNSEYPGILDTLRWVVNVEAPRRKKLIGDHGKVNINDFKAAYPDIKLPYIYIVVDEMVTLSDMIKEDEKEYQSYLKMIVTQFPNLGIRGMFVPHEVKNQVIDKTAYDSIKARISVKGSPEHIESSTGTKPRAFPYKLANTGDMAVNIDVISVKTIFVHGVALTSSNESNVKLFDYLRRMWARLEPEEIKNSRAAGVDDDRINDDLLKSIDDEEDLGLLEDSFEDSEVNSNTSEDEKITIDNMNNMSTLDGDFLKDFR